MRTALMVVTLAGSLGCGAHSTMRGSVVMKVSETEAHVCMGRDEVKEGQSIRLYHNDCKVPVGGKPAQIAESCRKQPGGEGQVSKVLNEHYSVVRFAAGVEFQEGDTIETIKR